MTLAEIVIHELRNAAARQWSDPSVSLGDELWRIADAIEERVRDQAQDEAEEEEALRSYANPLGQD